MTAMRTSLQVRGLGRQQVAAVAERAKRLGMTPQRYLKHLVEADLAISERARASNFKELLGSGEPADETEIDVLVAEAKTRYHRRRSRKE